MLTGEECVELHGNLALRRYIIEKAMNRAKYIEDAEDMIQAAWIRLWQEALPGQCMEHYEELALKAIRAAYMRCYRRHRKQARVRQMLTT